MKNRVYTEEMGQPPMDVDGGSAPPPKKPIKAKQKPKAYAKGGSVRGGGIAKRGVGKGRMC